MKVPIGMIQGLTIKELMGSQKTVKFREATPGKTFQFPGDHYEHNDYRLEWWYLNGNVTDDKNNSFPFHVSFFRMAFDIPRVDRKGVEKLHQIFLCNISITDVLHNQYYHGERYAYHDIQQCGLERSPFKLWVDDWQLSALQNETLFPLKLDIVESNFSLSLELFSAEDALLIGENGYDKKGWSNTSASYHYTYPKINVSGQICLNNQTLQVQGKAIYDREWGTCFLDDSQQGWDWFSMHLSNGDMLVYASLRKLDGMSDAASNGYLLDKDNKITHLKASDVVLEVVNWWHCDKDTKYPIEWKMQLIPLNWSLCIKAVIPNQLFHLTIAYWEGGVVICGDREGSGFLEMFGY